MLFIIWTPVEVVQKHNKIRIIETTFGKTMIILHHVSQNRYFSVKSSIMLLIGKLQNHYHKNYPSINCWNHAIFSHDFISNKPPALNLKTEEQKNSSAYHNIFIHTPSIYPYALLQNQNSVEQGFEHAPQTKVHPFVLGGSTRNSLPSLTWSKSLFTPLNPARFNEKLWIMRTKPHCSFYPIFNVPITSQMARAYVWYLDW